MSQSPAVTYSPAATRAQDIYAEAMALQFASVEVRVMADGIASVTGREPLPGSIYAGPRTWLVNEGGDPLTLPATLTRDERLNAEAHTEVQALDRTAPEFVERVREIARRRLYCWPQYDGQADAARVAVATYRLRTKGGLSQEQGDVVLVLDRDRDGIHVTVFSFRRGQNVATPAGYVRVLPC